MDFLSLDALSTELLLKIFKYLNVFDLCRLRLTCRRINNVINAWAHEFVKSEDLLATNQVHSTISTRSARILPPFERVRISRNWKLGFFKEKQFLKSKVKYIPWLQLEKDLLWLSRGNEILAFERTEDGINSALSAYKINIRTKADVSRFVKRDDWILSGHTDGSLLLWSTSSNNSIANFPKYHKADIHSVDLCQNVLLSGSRDNYVKLSRIRKIADCLLYGFKAPDRVWSVALTPNLSSFALGTSGIILREPILIYDIETAVLISNVGIRIVGDGVLDMKWTDPTNLWTCGYGGDVRHWDIRTGNCEQTFTDPYHDGMYCFEYDQCNTILSGSQTNGRVILWDTRQTNYVQMYYMESCRRRDKSSPIYGLSFDADYLFTATDHHLNMLDFSVHKGETKDYSNIFSKSIGG